MSPKTPQQVGELAGVPIYKYAAGFSLRLRKLNQPAQISKRAQRYVTQICASGPARTIKRNQAQQFIESREAVYGGKDRNGRDCIIMTAAYEWRPVTTMIHMGNGFAVPLGSTTQQLVSQ